jgi:two-component system, sensor histidine kinase ChiS
MVLNLKKANKDKESFTAIKHELDVAKKIQNSILPKKIPSLDHIEIAVNYFPMTQVGGDFYDFHVIDKNKIGIFIGDVSGHGVPAAIIASMLKIAFSIQAAFADDPSRVINRINKSLLGNVGQSFVSAAYIFIDLEENIMRVVRSGHPTPFHYSTDTNSLNEFNTKGKIIGQFEDTNSEMVEVSISKGDRIVLYTDGVIEARNNRNEMFGEELFKGYIKKHIQLKANDLAKLIMSDVKTWTGNHINKTDDITILVIDIK